MCDSRQLTHRFGAARLSCSGRLINRLGIGIFGTTTPVPLFQLPNRLLFFFRQPPTATGLPIRVARAGNGGGRIWTIASMSVGNPLVSAKVFSRLRIGAAGGHNLFSLPCLPGVVYPSALLIAAAADSTDSVPVFRTIS